MLARMDLRILILSTFGGLGLDVARISFRILILNTLAAWAQIWPEKASEC